MVCSLRRGVGVAVVRVPAVLGFVADGLAIALAAFAFLLPTADSVANEMSDNVVLDFTATWCGPCRQMSPIVRKLEQQGYAIRAVDVDREPQLAQRFNIQTIPCFVLVMNGKEVTRISGPTSEGQLRQLAQQAGNAQQRAQQNPAPAVIPLKQTSAPQADAGEQAPTNASLGQPAASADFFTGPSPQRRKALLDVPKPKFWPFAANDKVKLADEKAVVRGQARDSEYAAETEPGNQLLAATARLRVNDGKGTNFGTGTIVDSRPGQTTILTCGHIFRQPPAKAKVAVPPTVEVDIFQADGRPETYVGKLVVFDLAGDVGIVTIPTADTLPVIPIASLDEIPAVRDQLTSIGCGGGDVPSVEQVQVTAINRYDGPDNIECTGFPVQGRSGGGLFDARGQLTGVCIAADKEDRRGLYTGLKPIYEILQRAGLQQLLPVSQDQASPADEPAQTLAEGKPAENRPAKEDAQEKVFQTTDPELAGSAEAAASSAELAALFDEAPDAEVVCIVRPKNGSAKRVVILNQASTRFISYLLDSVDRQTGSATQAASLRVEESAPPSDNDWVADSDAGVPKKAPRLGSPKSKKPAGEAPMARRNRFGSRDEN